MKTLKFLTASLLAAAFLSSCVSTKKYQSAITEREALANEQLALQRTIAAQDTQIMALEAQMTDALAEQSQSLKATEAELAAREARLAKLEGLVNDQQLAIQSLHAEVCSALKCFTPDELSVDVRDGKLYVSLSDKLLFDSGSDNVNDRGREAIEMLSVVLQSSDLEIMVEGHTDSIPIASTRNRDNWDLSVHRATSVTRLLIDQGLNPDRIIASGRAQHQPVATNETADGRKLNRRTEIVLSPRLDKLWELTETDLSTTDTNFK